MKNIAIFGSTGSIGTQTLSVIREHLDLFRVSAITAFHNSDILQKQVEEFQPAFCGISDANATTFSSGSTSVFYGSEANEIVAREAEIDIAVIAASGASILPAAFILAKRGIRIALATKEVAVAAGALFTDAVREGGSELLPVDSEHSAIFQCLCGNGHSAVNKLILTASGGSLLRTPIEELPFVTVEQALGHPNWRMGKKITVDCASMMNKGLEVIEAHVLFSIPYEQISVLVHPQSIIHSMVEYTDGSIIAQLSSPDMRLPISYALSYPQRMSGGVPFLDLISKNTLTFEEVNLAKYPCFSLAVQAGKAGGNAPCVMNAANEIAVQAFLRGEIPFTDIASVVEHTLLAIPFQSISSVHQIIEQDSFARVIASNYLNR